MYFLSVLCCSLCCRGKYFYSENLKLFYADKPFPVSPAGYSELNLCAITDTAALIYVIELYKVLLAVIIIINTEL